MPADFALPSGELVSMGVSLFCGALIGLEREYRNKSTGLRTILLICLGSTVFTLISQHGQGTDDRISANIITGIGFIGAGVIFKDKIGVLGLTTASVIWVSAAIGMTAGAGAHSLALIVTAIVMLVLLFFGKLEQWVNTLPQNLQLTVTLNESSAHCLERLDAQLRQFHLKSKRLGISKGDGGVIVSVQVRGRAQDIAALQQHLLELDYVLSFY